MSLKQLVEKLKQYVGRPVEIEYYKGRYTKQAYGTLREANEEYIVLKGATYYTRGYEEEAQEILIRTPWIVSVIVHKKIDLENIEDEVFVEEEETPTPNN